MTANILNSTCVKNPIAVAAVADAALGGLGLGLGFGLAKKLMKNPFLTQEQIHAIEQVSGKNPVNLRVGKEGAAGLIWVKCDGKKYIFDRHGQNMKNPVNPTPNPTAECPACGHLNTFSAWDAFVRCTKCHARLRHVIVRRK